MTELRNIEVALLQESKTNPRQIFDKQKMTELVASIKEAGIITPLLVRVVNGHHEIVDGACRFRAAIEAKMTVVPAIVRQLTDEQAMESQIIANDQRSDVHPLEQCAGYLQLQKKCNYSLEDLAKHVGKSVTYVAKRLKFADLIEPIRKMFLTYEITSNHAFIAARLTPAQQKETLPWLKRGDSAVGFNNEVQRNFFLVLKDAPFDTADEKLVGKAGSCVNCPKRTGFNKALFEDVKEADTCTDPVCFEEKVRTFIKIQVGTHKDAVLLTIADQYNNRSNPKHLTQWVKAGDKNCPDTKEGVVVEQTAYRASENQAAKLGAVIKVCTNPKCKTHKQQAEERTRAANPANEAAKKADKTRRIELRRRGMMFKELTKEHFAIDNKDDYRAILDWAILQLSSDDARAICYAMEWEVAKAEYGGKDYTGTVQKHLAKLDANGVHQWLYLIMLAGSELWFYANTTVKKPKLLEAKAKEEGCEFTSAAVVKLDKEKKAEKAAAKKKAVKK